MPLTALQFNLSAPCSALHPYPSTFCGQVALVGRQPPSAAPDELVAMGTVNGLESGVFGPDINTQRLILPAGRQWEKDTGGGEVTKERSCTGERAFLS